MLSRSMLHAIAGLVIALLFTVGSIGPAYAQSFFETLFGGPKAPNSRAGDRAPSRLLPPGAAPTGINSAAPYSVRQMVPRNRSDGDDDRSPSFSAADSSRSFRTVCVRMCDGFYWPVSFAAPRSRFYRDANACSSSCTSEAKLFHFPSKGAQIDDAVDLSGRVYSRLPTAFRYRKALVKGCACKADPWSEIEKDRHRNYAMKAETGKDDAISSNKSAEYPVPPPSGSQENVVVSDAKVDDPLPSRSETVPKGQVAIVTTKPKSPKLGKIAEPRGTTSDTSRNPRVDHANTLRRLSPPPAK